METTTADRRNNQRNLTAFFLVLLFAAGLFFFKMGDWPLFDADEGRYSEIPREMLESGDWITPRLNYVKYFEKPPLLYWVNAVCFKVFGFSEGAARIPCALPALLGVLLTFFLGLRMFGGRAGFLSALILMTSLEYYVLSRILLTDMLLALLMTCAFAAFWLAYTTQARRGWLLAFWASLALATLAKGPVAVVLIFLVIGIFLASQRELAFLRQMEWIRGGLLYLVIAAPWFILVSLRNPEFAWFFFVNEHILRFLTKKHQRYHPFYFFIYVLAAGLLPWSAFLPAALKKGLSSSKRKEVVFLGLWSLVIFAFFSLSGSKLVPYILPIFPALALILGAFFDRYFREAPWREIRLASVLTGLTYILLAFALLYVAKRQHVVRYETVQTLVGTLVGILVIAGLLLIARFKARMNSQIFSDCFTAAVAVSMALLFVIEVGAPYKSVKQTALQIVSQIKPSDQIVELHCYYPGLAYYTQHRILHIGGKNELEFGASVEPSDKWFMKDEKDLCKLLASDQRVFCLTTDERYAKLQTDYRGKLYPLRTNYLGVLFSNKDR